MNLQALKKALQPLTLFGTEETTFEVDGTKVFLRPLLPKEEIACQRYSAAVFTEAQEEDGLEDNDALTKAAALRYFDQFRSEILSYALVQIGPTDLRKVEYIETGEMLEDNTPVKVRKQVAVRGIISESWSRGIITIAFSKYGSLITQIADKADKIAQESISDLEAEVERVENRLASLKEEMERRAKGDPSVTTKQIVALVAAGETLKQEVDQAIDVARSDRQEAERILREAREEAPEEAREEAPEEAPEKAPPAPTPSPRQPVTPAAAPPPSKKIKTPQSRIEEARRLAEEGGRRGLIAEEVSKIGKEILGPDGKPVPTMHSPTQTLSSRGEKSEEAPPMRGGVDLSGIDPDPNQGTLNPDFKK